MELELPPPEELGGAGQACSRAGRPIGQQPLVRGDEARHPRRRQTGAAAEPRARGERTRAADRLAQHRHPWPSQLQDGAGRPHLQHAAQLRAGDPRQQLAERRGPRLPAADRPVGEAQRPNLWIPLRLLHARRDHRRGSSREGALRPRGILAGDVHLLRDGSRVEVEGGGGLSQNPWRAQRRRDPRPADDRAGLVDARALVHSRRAGPLLRQPRRR